MRCSITVAQEHDIIVFVDDKDLTKYEVTGIEESLNPSFLLLWLMEWDDEDVVSSDEHMVPKNAIVEILGRREGF